MAKTEKKKARPGNKQPDLKDFDEPDDDGAAFDYDHKAAVECLCPSCGKKHWMNFHWIGRGVPRKFCKSCRPSS